MRASFVSYVNNRSLLFPLAYETLKRGWGTIIPETDARSIVSTILARSKNWDVGTVDEFLHRACTTGLISIKHGLAQWQSGRTLACLAALGVYTEYSDRSRNSKEAGAAWLRDKAILPQWHEPITMMSYYIWKKGEVYRIADVLDTAVPSLGAWYRERLEEGFFDTPWFERYFLGDIAWPLGDASFWEQALKDCDRDTRRQAALILGTARISEAKQALFEILSDDDDQVRAWGAWAMGRLATVDAIGNLISLLEDPGGRVRVQARQALDLIQGVERKPESIGQVLSSKIPKTGKKVLVSDDEPEMLEFYKMILKRMGYEVLCAPDGKQTLELARCEHPALVITDRMNINMEGTDLVFELRSEMATRNIPIVVCSAEPPDWLLFFWGADFFLQKPVSPANLVPFVSELLAD